MTDQACDFTTMSAPTEAHGRLKPYAGTFNAVVKMWMGPGDPTESSGVMINEFDLGGRYLQQTYTGDQQEGAFPNFEGRGYWGFNKTEEKYEGFNGFSDIWIDNLPSVRINTNGLITRYDKAEFDKWFGFRLQDREGGSISTCFAPKAGFVDKFLEFENRRTKLNVKGIVVELENSSQHGIIVTDVEILE